MKKCMWYLLLAGFGMVFCYSAWRLWTSHVSDQEAQDSYQKLREQTERKLQNGKRDIDFKKLKKINSDVIGWIYIPGTEIDYPIVQGKDNEEYLHETVDGTKNRSGAIFMDHKGKKDFSADNNVIYGHHMKNGTMFADLLKFREKAFVKKHPVILLTTPGDTKKLRVISAYAKEANTKIPILFSAEKDRKAYLKFLWKESEVPHPRSEEEKKRIKRIYTFVTCSYEKEDYRTFVHAVEE